MNTEQMKPHQPRIRLIDTPGCRARVGCDSAGSAPVIDHVRACWGGRGRGGEVDWPGMNGFSWDALPYRRRFSASGSGESDWLDV